MTGEHLVAGKLAQPLGNGECSCVAVSCFAHSLHFEDVRKLLEVLHSLVEQGNTVVVIEHNLDVIKTADWIIDIGPEGGDGGGRIVATGTPEDVAQIAESHTGRYLAPMLETARKRAAAE